MGDFGHRRLPSSFLTVWDNWLQTGLQGLRKEQSDWVAHYLEAPLWFFALGLNLASSQPWIGVLMPSVDSVGRYFPLTLAIELVRSDEASADLQMARIHHWWQRSAKAALMALNANMDATSFEVSLFALFDESADLPAYTPSMLVLPEAGMSSWFVDIDKGDKVVHVIPGLPTPAGFEILFGALIRQ